MTVDNADMKVADLIDNDTGRWKSESSKKLFVHEMCWKLQ
jgi:hypothetical protein